MDFQQENNDLLPVRLNAEPSIFRGCSLSELMLLVTMDGIVMVPDSVIVYGLFGYLMMGVGIGLLLVIAWVVICATVLQKLKCDRLLRYYQLRLRLWLEDLRLLRSTFIRKSQIWDIDRRLK